MAEPVPTNAPRHRSLTCLDPVGFHRVAYSEVGPPDAPVVVCVHGLTRNGADFATIAAALSDTRRVVCVDVAGRGASDWLSRVEDYGYPVYMADLAALIARLDVDTVDWIGTSMGGLIGMLLAARTGTPIRRLVLNDVGPFLPSAALERIADYVGRDPRFADRSALDAYLADVHAPFGPFTDDEWRAFVEASARPVADGEIALAYDPAIGEAFRAAPVADVDLWPVWDAIDVPALVIRGEVSDVLTEATAREMIGRGPRARLVHVAGVGHAPTLNGAVEIAEVRTFLDGERPAR